MDGVSGFEGLRVSELSDWLTYTAAAKCGILLSAAEAAAVIACGGSDDSEFGTVVNNSCWKLGIWLQCNRSCLFLNKR